MDIETVQLKKDQCEKDVITLLNNFIEQTGCSIEELHLRRYQVFGRRNEAVESVMMKVVVV